MREEAQRQIRGVLHPDAGHHENLRGDVRELSRDARRCSGDVVSETSGTLRDARVQVRAVERRREVVPRVASSEVIQKRLVQKLVAVRDVARAADREEHAGGDGREHHPVTSEGAENGEAAEATAISSRRRALRLRETAAEKRHRRQRVNHGVYPEVRRHAVHRRRKRNLVTQQTVKHGQHHDRDERLARAAGRDGDGERVEQPDGHGRRARFFFAPSSLEDALDEPAREEVAGRKQALAPQRVHQHVRDQHAREQWGVSVRVALVRRVPARHEPRGVREDVVVHVRVRHLEEGVLHESPRQQGHAHFCRQDDQVARVHGARVAPSRPPRRRPSRLCHSAGERSKRRKRSK